MADHHEELFAAIHRDYAGLLARVVHAFAPEPADRDDVFQEILLSLWQALPQFDGRAKISTYVYRVALSTALNWKRSRRRYREKLDQFALAPPDFSATSSPRDRERLRWLYGRIHELPPVDRTLMLLSLDRLGYGEIAEITGLSESNVGVRLHRIKHQLILQSETIKDEI